ncbi:MAG: transporter substrate-binding domain-containing protein, partial [Candidatus Bipolaricaulia bacterium]
RSLLIFGFLVILTGAWAVSAAAATFTVASNTTWPPFEWAGADGQLYGFDLDVMRLIAILEGYEVDIVSYSWDIIFDDVGIGRVDIGASGATITAEREMKVDFSAPYWTSNQAVIVKADSGLNIATALASGKRIGAQIGTTGAKWVQEQLIDKGIQVELKEYTLYPLAVLDLLNGNVDAVIQDEPASRASIAADARLAITAVIETGEQFGFFVADGDPKGLLPKINDGLQKLKSSTAWDDLIAAYMGGADLTKIETAWKAAASFLAAKDVVGFAKALAAGVAAP